MVQASDIRPHMAVVGSDGGHVGTIDHVDGDRIKLARKDAGDGRHHYLPLTAIARIDQQVHLKATAAATLATFTDGAGYAAAGPIADTARRNYLPWILGIIGLIILFLLLRSCMQDRAAPPPAQTSDTAPATAPLALEAVTLPNGTRLQLAPKTLNYDLQRYLASAEATPRTFTFDKLNFDTGSSALRPVDLPNVDALAQILAAYPQARARIVGYTDSRGSAPANAKLGQDRARSVATALTAKGVDQARLETVSGGETNPADTNANAQGQFDNRRTELVVTAK